HGRAEQRADCVERGCSGQRDGELHLRHAEPADAGAGWRLGPSIHVRWVRKYDGEDADAGVAHHGAGVFDHDQPGDERGTNELRSGGAGRVGRGEPETGGGGRDLLLRRGEQAGDGARPRSEQSVLADVGVYDVRDWGAEAGDADVYYDGGMRDAEDPRILRGEAGEVEGCGGS